MALATYSDLQTSVAAWLRRTDLTSAIPDFIALAEAQINRRLRHRRMVTRTTLTLTGEYLDVPTDFAGVKTFVVPSTPPVPLQQLTADQLEQRAASTWPDGRTQCFAVVGDEFRFFPAPTEDVDADLTYWALIPALSVSAPTNWLLTSSPDIYLYGALLQSAPYLRSDDRVTTWSSLYIAALADLEAANDDLSAVLTPTPSIVV